jgi:hypothetical protein
MGTTLTGTTPQDTYDSLIKVTDNGPLSGTAKYLSDGLGNDSALALSTARVGIGTATPTHLLQLFAASAPELRLGDATTTIQMYTAADEAVLGTVGSHPFVFRTNATERMRVTSAGNVGIGTTAPAVSLQIGQDSAGNLLTGKSIIYGAAQDGSGTPVEILTLARPFQAAVSFLGAASLCVAKDTANANSRAAKLSIKLSDNADETDFVAASFTKNGLCFNSDTAAANALDDYEEGTFTPTATSNIAINQVVNATYTKIGNLVSFQIWIKVDITGADWVIDGLPISPSGRTTNAISNINQKETLANQTVGTNIYAYASSVANGVDLFIGGNYRVA